MEKKIEEFLSLSESQQQAFLDYETVAIKKQILEILSKDIETLKNQPDDDSPSKMNARRQLIELYESLEYVEVTEESANCNEAKKLEPKRFVSEQIKRIRSQNHESVREHRMEKRKRSMVAKIELKMFAYWRKNFAAIRNEVMGKAIEYLNSKESTADFAANATKSNGTDLMMTTTTTTAAEKIPILFDSRPLPKNASNVREFTKIFVQEQITKHDEPIDLDSISNECKRLRTDSGDAATIDTAIASTQFAQNPQQTVQQVFKTVLNHKNKLYKSMDLIRKDYLSRNTKPSSFDALFQSVNDFALSVEKIAKMISNNCNADHLKILRALQCQYYGPADVDRDKKSLTTKNDKRVAQNASNVPSGTSTVVKPSEAAPAPAPAAKPYNSTPMTINKPRTKAFPQHGPQNRQPMPAHKPFQPSKRPADAVMSPYHNTNQMARFGGVDDDTNGHYGPPMKKMNMMNSMNQPPHPYHPHHANMQQQRQQHPQHQQQHMMPMNRMGPGPMNQMRPPPINNTPNYSNPMIPMNEYFTRREPHEYQQSYTKQQQSNYHPNFYNRRPY